MTTRRRDAVHARHRRTKHQLQRCAAGPGRQDRQTQPDPFRWLSARDTQRR
jgi:hypothetical protein